MASDLREGVDPCDGATARRIPGGASPIYRIMPFLPQTGHSMGVGRSVV